MSPVVPEDIGDEIAFAKKLTLGEQITPFVTEIPSFPSRVSMPCVLRRA